ncbi:hypothetical protein ACFVH7_27245 [Kitasatospora indigofera]|uniref:hypothetical protein n=1 Tax=Kitasatospora indigofera TaxID=67307 RepID=UPI0036393C73
MATDSAWRYEDGPDGSLVVRPGIWGWAGPMTTLGPLTALADEELETALTGEAFEIWADTPTGRTVVPVGNSRTTTLDMLRRDLKKGRKVAADAQGVVTVDAHDFRGDPYRVYVNAGPASWVGGLCTQCGCTRREHRDLYKPLCCDGFRR